MTKPWDTLRPIPEVQEYYRNNPEARQKLIEKIAKQYPVMNAYLAEVERREKEERGE